MTIVVDISSQIFGPTAKPGLTVAEWVNGTGHYLGTMPHNTDVLGSAYFEKKKWFGHVTLGMGTRGSSVRFEFIEANKKAPARLRIELNPRKLGPSGFKTLLAVLLDKQGPFDGKAVLSAAKVTRLDIAVDLEGVQTGELLAFHAQQQQRSLYVGTDGLLETFYVHGKSSKAQPSGKVLLSVYDRVRERAKRGKPPPFGPSPVTRIEVIKRMKSPNNSLAQIDASADPFKPIRVGYAVAQGAAPASWWQQYVGLRRTKSHEDASAMLGLTSSTAVDYAAAYEVPKANLVRAGFNWPGWKHGLIYTGLQLLLNAAK